MEQVGKVLHRVVIQLNNNDIPVWKAMISNIQNLKKAWHETVVIEVVAHGTGIELLLKGQNLLDDVIYSLQKQGVVFLVCEHTLHSRMLDNNALLPDVITVPSAVAEIVLKQEQGWSYLKAGF